MAQLSSIRITDATMAAIEARSEPDGTDARETTGNNAVVRHVLEGYFQIMRIGELALRRPFSPAYERENIVDALQRYSELLRQGRRTLRRLFTPEECAVIVAATNGTLEMTPSLIPVSPQCVIDALYVEDGVIVGCDGLVMESERLASIDYKAFREKLKNLTVIQAFAFVDACERYWNHPEITPYERLFEEDQAEASSS